MFGTLPEYSCSKYMSSLLHDIFLPETMKEKIVYVLVTFGTHRFVTDDQNPFNYFLKMGFKAGDAPGLDGFIKSGSVVMTVSLSILLTS